VCPREIAVPVWCAHMGTLTFHPWAVRCDDVDHPDELRIDLDRNRVRISATRSGWLAWPEIC
jgi:DNA primase